MWWSKCRYHPQSLQWLLWWREHEFSNNNRQSITTKPFWQFCSFLFDDFLKNGFLLWISIVGCWKSFVLLEQWVHTEYDRRKFHSDSNDHVPSIVSHLERTLEPDNCGTGVQCTQDIHGDQQQTVRWINV